MTALVVIAFVGIIGLMVFGLNQISFAAGESGKIESFTSAQGENEIKIIGNVKGGGEGDGFSVLGFYGKMSEGADFPVYCIEFNADYVPGKKYLLDKNVDSPDRGLAYLMSNLYSKVGGYAQNVQVWLTQTAI